MGQKLTDITANWMQFELNASTWPSSTKLKIKKKVKGSDYLDEIPDTPKVDHPEVGGGLL